MLRTSLLHVWQCHNAILHIGTTDMCKKKCLVTMHLQQCAMLHIKYSMLSITTHAVVKKLAYLATVSAKIWVNAKPLERPRPAVEDMVLGATSFQGL